jgi:predicted nucleic acid-binding protein
MAVSVYLDTSLLVALLTGDDAFTDRASVFPAADPDVLVVSDFAAAEFSSVMARLTRMRRLTQAEALAVFAAFDAWRARAIQSAVTLPQDIGAAAAFLRRLDMNLRTPDAINIAIAHRVGAALATFDEAMASNARTLGMAVAAA